MEKKERQKQGIENEGEIRVWEKTKEIQIRRDIYFHGEIHRKEIFIDMKELYRSESDIQERGNRQEMYRRNIFRREIKIQFLINNICVRYIKRDTQERDIYRQERVIEIGKRYIGGRYIGKRNIEKRSKYGS